MNEEMELNSTSNEILKKIKLAVFNPQYIHIADERRVACIFYNSFKQNGPNYPDAFRPSLITEALPPGYSEDTKKRIRDIAEVVATLSHCDES
jgi:hypothetical protein